MLLWSWPGMRPPKKGRLGGQLPAREAPSRLEAMEGAGPELSQPVTERDVSRLTTFISHVRLTDRDIVTLV